MSIPCVENTTFTLTDPYSMVPFKKVFICLPFNGMLNRDIEKRVDEIEAKVKKRFPEWNLLIHTGIDNLWTPEEIYVFEPTGRDGLEALGDAIKSISTASLIIFGTGWSGSAFCTEIHRILDNSNNAVEYMYEWDLDKTIEEFCKIYGSH